SKLHHAVLEKYAEDVLRLAPRFSHAAFRAPLSPELARSIDEDVEEFASTGRSLTPLLRHQKVEPYRLKLELIAERLRATLDAPVLDSSSAKPVFSYANTSELLADLELVDRNLERAGYHRSRWLD